MVENLYTETIIETTTMTTTTTIIIIIMIIIISIVTKRKANAQMIHIHLSHRTPKFLISYISVTLNEVQGHPNRYQNVELRGLYHHTKLERNQSIND